MHCNGSSAPYAADPPSSERLLKGRLLGGRYFVEHLIGSGAMGRVYRAWHVGLARSCAVKVIREPLGRSRAPSRASARSETLQSTRAALRMESGEGRRTSRADGSLRVRTVPSGGAVARFQAEARAASRLDHPNIVRLIDFGCEEGFERDPGGTEAERASLWYLVTEYLDGEDLIDLLNAEPILPLRRIVAIMRQLCAALQHAHDAGVIHRDIKPENIRLVPRIGDDGEPFEQVKLLDFGTSKLFREDAYRALASETPFPPLDEDCHLLLSETPAYVIGTPAYMSPEQAAGQRVDPRSDVYACGVLLFEMATGRLPFDRSTPNALAAAHIESPPPPPSAFHAEVDPRLEALILRCLRKTPEDRPESARALAEALDQLNTPAASRSAWRAAPRERFAPSSRPSARAVVARALQASTWVGHRSAQLSSTPLMARSAGLPDTLGVSRRSSFASTWVGYRPSPRLLAEHEATHSMFPSTPPERAPSIEAPSAPLFAPIARPRPRPRRRAGQRSDGWRRARRFRRASPAMIATVAAAVLGVSVCVGMGVAGGLLGTDSALPSGRNGAAFPSGDGGSPGGGLPTLESPIHVKLR